MGSPLLYAGEAAVNLVNHNYIRPLVNNIDNDRLIKRNSLAFTIVESVVVTSISILLISNRGNLKTHTGLSSATMPRILMKLDCYFYILLMKYRVCLCHFINFFIWINGLFKKNCIETVVIRWHKAMIVNMAVDSIQRKIFNIFISLLFCHLIRSASRIRRKRSVLRLDFEVLSAYHSLWGIQREAKKKEKILL